jgi:hypothetical protein
MNNIEKYLDTSPEWKEYYTQTISKLTEEQKSDLEDLIIRLDKAGAKNPLQWAISEITENIPQFGRFLVLKKLFEIANDIDRAIEFAEAYADDYADLEEKMLQNVDKSLLKHYLAAYNRGMIG